MEKDQSLDLGEFTNKYEHLNSDTPIEVWIAEFLARNRYFENDCRKFVSAWRKTNAWYVRRAGQHTLEAKYGVVVSGWIPNKNGRTGPLTVFLPPAVREIRIVAKSPVTAARGSKKGLVHLDPFSRFRDQSLRRVGDHGQWRESISAEDGKQREIGAHESVINDLLGSYPTENGSYAVPDTLLLGIDLRRSPGEIRKLINGFLKGHLPKSRPHRVRKEWRHYLMVYDLVTQRHWSHSKVAQFLANMYPAKSLTHENLASERNITNYFQNAEALINGGYKDFLY